MPRPLYEGYMHLIEGDKHLHTICFKTRSELNYAYLRRNLLQESKNIKERYIILCDKNNMYVNTVKQ